MATLNTDPKIHRPDQRKQVKMGGVNIMGNLGSSVVVSSGSMTGINIAGGDVNGNVYQEISNSAAQTFEQIKSIVSDLGLKSEEQDDALKAAENIRQELDKGEKADEGLIHLMLTTVGGISPVALKYLVDWITNSTTATKNIRTTAQSALKFTAK